MFRHNETVKVHGLERPGSFLIEFLTFFSFSHPFEFFREKEREIARSAHGPTDEPEET
jgi:hypothetical protein